MHLLAIETATESCSVALVCADRLLLRAEVAPRRHAELLLPMCDEVLAEAGLARNALDAIAVGRGPGAFTGVRLGVAAAQGMALALDVPIVPVSSLAALAMHAPDDEATILATIDARMGEVYAGVFRRTDDGRVEPVADERVCAAGALELPAATGWRVVGTGWASYRETLAARLTAPLRSAEGDRFPRADHVALLALPIARAGQGMAPEHVAPVYLRDKVALTMAEQEAARSGASPAR